MMKRSFPALLIIMGLVAVNCVLHLEANAVRLRSDLQQELRLGKIEGRVFDSEGKPAARFKVYADKNDSERGCVYNTRTDKDGFFLFEEVLTGKYTIYAGNEFAGYPESASAIYLDAVRYVKVEVKKEQSTPQFVVLTLGPQLGKLSGKIEDASTKKPLTDAQVTLRLADIPTYRSSSNVDEKGRFKFMVPPAPITIEVSAVGYETWFSSGNDADQQSEAFQVDSGQTKELIISMRPVKQP